MESLPASSLFPILALAAIIYGTGIVFNQSLYSLGKPKIQRNIILMTVALFFVLAIPLIMLFSTFGMCFAYLLSILFFFITSYRSTKNILNTSLPWGSIKKIIIASIGSLIFLYIVATKATNIIFVLVFSALAGLIYLEILFLLKFYTKQDIIVIEAIIEKLPVFKKQFMEIFDFISKFV
jgi:O-antigen/teichoic acid export membrane protein